MTAVDVTPQTQTSAPQGAVGVGSRFLLYYAASLCVGLLAIVAGVVSGPETSTAIVFGAGAATAAGLLAFPAVHAGLAHGTNGLFAGLSAGMLIRMLLVAGGLFGSGLHGPTALVYAFSFFFVYAGTMAVEIAYVFSVSKARAPASPPSDSK